MRVFARLVLACLGLGLAGTLAAAPAPPLHVADFTAPAAFSALGPELSRALSVALRHAGVEVRAVATTPDQTVTGRLEIINGDHARLFLRLRGLAVEATGDLEHLDDVAEDGAQQLVDLLSHPVAPVDKPVVVTPKLPPVKPVAVKPAAVKPVAVKPDPPRSVVALPRPPDMAAREEAPPAREVPPPPADPPPTPPREVSPPPLREVTPLPPPAPTPQRVAVHIVGMPPRALSSLQFYAAGVASQRALINFLHQRLRVSAVPSDLQGLTSGAEANSHALRHGTRLVLMARFDRLFITPGPIMAFGNPPLNVVGRIHVVLLLDGYQQLDRSLDLPPTTVGPNETPDAMAARAVSAAMEQISGELGARLAQLR